MALSSLVIDDLQHRALTENYAVAYIYFNYKEQEQQGPNLVIAILVKQLACQIRHLPKDMEDLYDKLKHRQKIPTFEDLYGILRLLATTKSFVQTFIICDALDECGQEAQRKVLLPLFHRMGKDGMNLFLTSREYPEDIQYSLRDSAKIKLWAKDEDIAFYIEQR